MHTEEMALKFKYMQHGFSWSRGFSPCLGGPRKKKIQRKGEKAKQHSQEEEAAEHLEKFSQN